MKTGIFLDRNKNRIDSKEIVLNRGEYVYYVNKKLCNILFIKCKP